RAGGDAGRLGARAGVRQPGPRQALGGGGEERGDHLTAVMARRQRGERGSDDGRMVLAVHQGEDAHGARSVEVKSPGPVVTEVSGWSSVDDAVVLRAEGLVQRFRGIE